MEDCDPSPFANPRLSIELVPSSSWFDNVRARIPVPEWDFLRKQIYTAAEDCCEICGGRGSNHPVECHERWHYDDKKKIQRLDGLLALCPACHQVKHIGLAEVRGLYDQSISQLCKVNGWDSIDATEYVQAAFDIWAARSKHEWEVDILVLDELLRDFRTKRSGEIQKMWDEPLFDF